MRDIKAALRSDDPDLVAEAYERVVLEGLGLDDADFEGLASAYREISDRLLTRRETERSGAFRSADPRMGAGAWALVYGWRTFARVRALLREIPEIRGPVLEIGAGFGPAGLAAAAHGLSEVRLVEPEAAATRSSGRVYQAAGLAEPEIRVQSAAAITVGDASTIILPYSLWEIVPPSPSEQSARELVLKWLGSLESPGNLLVLEAGTREASRRVQTLRDAIWSDCSVVGPCRGAHPCPKLAPSSEWCHFTWSMRPGPLTRRVMDLAERRWQEVHGSWLAVRSAPTATLKGDARVLDVRARGKGKVEAEVCGPSGLERLVALRRHREALDLVGGLPSGGLVEMERDALVVKGDGLRVESGAALRVVE